MDYQKYERVIVEGIQREVPLKHVDGCTCNEYHGCMCKMLPPDKQCDDCDFCKFFNATIAVQDVVASVRYAILSGTKVYLQSLNADFAERVIACEVTSFGNILLTTEQVDTVTELV